MNTAVGCTSSITRSIAVATSFGSARSAGARYWWSTKSSHTGVAPSTSIAARSSPRRSPTTSSPVLNPPSASHSVGGSGYAGGRPPHTVTTVAPGCANKRYAAPRAASSKCGEHSEHAVEAPVGKDPPRDRGAGIGGHVESTTSGIRRSVSVW